MLVLLSDGLPWCAVFASPIVEADPLSPEFPQRPQEADDVFRAQHAPVLLIPSLLAMDLPSFRIPAGEAGREPVSGARSSSCVLVENALYLPCLPTFLSPSVIIGRRSLSGDDSPNLILRRGDSLVRSVRHSSLVKTAHMGSCGARTGYRWVADG